MDKKKEKKKKKNNNNKVCVPSFINVFPWPYREAVICSLQPPSSPKGRSEGFTVTLWALLLAAFLS